MPVMRPSKRRGRLCSKLLRPAVAAFLRFGGQRGPRAGGKFGEDECMRRAEVLLPLGGSEGIPTEGGDPVRACEIGRGHEGFALHEFGEADRTGGERCDRPGLASGELRVGWLIEVDDGEHFSAERFVAAPEDEVVAPLHSLGDVGKGEDIGADAFGVHVRKIHRRSAALRVTP